MCTFQLENKAARILHIGLGGGKILTIPPTVGGITVEMSDPEKAKFEIAIATEEVKSWIDGGVLVVTEKVEEPPPPEAGDGGTRLGGLPSTEPPPEEPRPEVEPPPEIPEHVRRGRRGGRDE